MPISIEVHIYLLWHKDSERDTGLNLTRCLLIATPKLTVNMDSGCHFKLLYARNIPALR